MRASAEPRARMKIAGDPVTARARLTELTWRRDVDRRVDRMGAMANTAGLTGGESHRCPREITEPAVVIAVGCQRLIDSRTEVSLPAGFSSDESTVSSGTGLGG